MADIELVIKIPEGLKNDFESEQWTALSCMEMKDALEKATPLPKGHGRLIDADRLTRAEIMHLWYHLPNGDIACPKVDIDHAPTIIEADKAESEDKE